MHNVQYKMYIAYCQVKGKTMSPKKLSLLTNHHPRGSSPIPNLSESPLLLEKHLLQQWRWAARSLQRSRSSKPNPPPPSLQLPINLSSHLLHRTRTAPRLHLDLSIIATHSERDPANKPRNGKKSFGATYRNANAQTV